MIITKNTKEAYDDIIHGIGWCTSDYITLNCDDLSSVEQYSLMIMLTNEGLLANEDELVDINVENVVQINETAIYTINQLKTDYLTHFNLIEY